MKKNSGFSLVELLVVISIIAVLTAVIMPNFMGARERARDAQRKQDLYAIKNALRMYYNDRQAYPTGTDLSGLSTYMPAILSLGFTYSYVQINNGDGFRLSTGLEASGGGSENTDSLTKCGFPTPVPTKTFGVCAN